MQKVYLLLRSNKQTGPYSLEELLQLNLKPFDLVWVDGRSAAWQYPFEIPALKPYVPETPHADVPFQPIATSAMEEKNSQLNNPTPKTEAAKRVFVSIPKSYTAANEQKNYANAHEAYIPPVEKSYSQIRKEAKPPTPSNTQVSSSFQEQKPMEEEIVHTNLSRSLNDVEEDYTNWMYKQKTKKKSAVNPKDLVLAALILTVIGGGYYVMSKPSVTNSVLPSNKATIPNSAKPIETVATEPQQINTIVADQNESSSSEQKIILNTNSVQPNHTNKNSKTKNPVIVSKAQANSSVPSSQNSMPVEKTTPNIQPPTDVASKEPGVTQQPKAQSPEKKKKIADVIKGIFSKKEKNAEETKNNPVVMDDPKPANNRQATRRDDNATEKNSASNEISNAALMQQIDLSSNAPDNWMMGVRNLKITLHNRSNVTIQTAAVTVNYYDENDKVLERKIVYFNNVAPKSKAIVAAPDQKWADHVDFQLTSASAKDDRYASN